MGVLFGFGFRSIGVCSVVGADDDRPIQLAEKWGYCVDIDLILEALLATACAR